MFERELDRDILTKDVRSLEGAAKIPFTVYGEKQMIYEKFADEILEIIRANNWEGRDTKLILPVGPKLHYPILIRRANEEGVSFRRVYIFMMDEYLDWQGRMIPQEHHLSFRGYLRGELAGLKDELKLPENHLITPDPMRIDEYSEKIASLGGIDACFGGVGSHGHVAFNEPPNQGLQRVSEEEFLASKTRIVHLAPETVVLNSIRATGGAYGAFPSFAVTVGMADILSASKIRLCCDGGPWQRYVLRMALVGERSLDYPVTFLQAHLDVRIYCDSATAAAVIPS